MASNAKAFQATTPGPRAVPAGATGEGPDHRLPDSDLDLMRTYAIIRVPADASFSFDGTDADFCLRADLDRLNFSELDPGVLQSPSGGLHPRPGSL